jgi:tetratricopeptide (TPR) repeat protein
VEDLDRAISIQTEAVDRTAHGDVLRPEYLKYRAEALQRRFVLLDDLTDLDSSISCIGEAVSTTPPEQQGRAVLLRNLAGVLQLRFDRLGNVRDLDSVVSCLEEALGLTPESLEAERLQLLGSLGHALQRRYELSRNVADIDRAIEVTEEALSSLPAAHPFRPPFMDRFAKHYEARYETLMDPSDRDKALYIRQQASSLEFTGGPTREAAGDERTPIASPSAQEIATRAPEPVSLWIDLAPVEEVDTIPEVRPSVLPVSAASHNSPESPISPSSTMRVAAIHSRTGSTPYSAPSP